MRRNLEWIVTLCERLTGEEAGKDYSPQLLGHMSAIDSQMVKMECAE